jgi:hypothetical protein
LQTQLGGGLYSSKGKASEPFLTLGFLGLIETQDFPKGVAQRYPDSFAQHHRHLSVRVSQFWVGALQGKENGSCYLTIHLDENGWRLLRLLPSTAGIV